MIVTGVGSGRFIKTAQEAGLSKEEVGFDTALEEIKG